MKEITWKRVKVKERKTVEFVDSKKKFDDRTEKLFLKKLLAPRLGGETLACRD